MTAALLAIVVLVIASAFFVAAEFSLIAARRSAIEPLAIASPRARATLAAMDDVSVMLACAQLGITVAGLVLGAVGEPAIAHLIEPALAAVGVPESATAAIGLIVGLLIVVGVHVAFGEMVPKNIAMTVPERTAVVLAPLLRGLAIGIGPVVRGLDHLANLVVRAVGITPSTEVASTVTRGELAALVQASAREGLLDAEDEKLIDAALAFDVTAASQLALGAEELVAVGPRPSAAEVEDACTRSGFSRFPVRAPGIPGRYLGYVHVRDVMGIPAAHRHDPIDDRIIRPLPDVTDRATVRAAVETMQRQRAHMCTLRDAADGDQRILLLEDALELLVGEIVDATRRTVPQDRHD